MNLVYFLAFVIVVAVTAFFTYRSMIEKTTEKLHLELKMRPVEVVKGERVKISCKMIPEEESQVEFINGSVFCRRYEDYKNSWQDYTEMPVFKNGQDVARIDFEFGKDMVLEAGKEVTFGGKIIIPDDAMPTEIKGIIQVHWFVIVRIKLKNQSVNAEITEELIVLPPKVFDGTGEEVDLGDLYDPTYDMRKEEEEAQKIAQTTESRIKMKERKKQQDERRREEQKHKKEEVKEEEKAGEEKFKVQYQVPFDPTKTAQAKAAALAMEAEGLTVEKGPDDYKPKFQAPFDPTKTARAQAAAGAIAEEKGEVFQREKPKFKVPFDPTKTAQAQAAAGAIAEEKGEVFQREKPKFQAPFDPTKTPHAKAAAEALAEEKGEPVKTGAAPDKGEVFQRAKPKFQTPFDPTKTAHAKAAAEALAKEKGEPVDVVAPRYQAPFEPTKTPQAKVAMQAMGDEKGKAKPKFQAPFDPTKTTQAQAATKALEKDNGYQAPFDPTKTPQAQAASAALGDTGTPAATGAGAGGDAYSFEDYLYGVSSGPSIPGAPAKTGTIEKPEKKPEEKQEEKPEVEAPSEEDYHKKHFVPTRRKKTKLKVKSLTGDDESGEVSSLKHRIGEEEEDESAEEIGGRRKFKAKRRSLKSIKASAEGDDTEEGAEEDDTAKKFKKKVLSRKRKKS